MRITLEGANSMNPTEEATGILATSTASEVRTSEAATSGVASEDSTPTSCKLYTVSCSHLELTAPPSSGQEPGGTILSLPVMSGELV